MIRPLRRRHRAAFVVLAVGLPVLALAALGARSAPARMESVPGDLRPPSERGPGGGAPVDRLDAFRVELRGDALTVVPPRGWNEPDVLVYWSAGAVTAEALPEDARLLGALPGGAPARFAHPSGAGGSLVLFSLAHGEVVHVEAIGGGS